MRWEARGHGFLVYFSRFRHFARRAHHWQGVSAGIFGEPQESPDAAFDLRRFGPDKAGRGYDSGVSDSNVAGGYRLAGCGDLHAFSCRSHYGPGRLPPGLRFARRKGAANLRYGTDDEGSETGLRLRLSRRAVAERIFYSGAACF